MNIDSLERLSRHLKLFRMKLKKEGHNEMQLYPMFCVYYDKNKEKFQLSKEQVLESACEILIEGK